MIEHMAEGKTLRNAARQLHVSDSAMQDTKNKLAVKVLDFMGADILDQIRCQPQWKDLLVATRERLACRDERRHL